MAPLTSEVAILVVLDGLVKVVVLLPVGDGGGQPPLANDRFQTGQVAHVYDQDGDDPQDNDNDDLECCQVTNLVLAKASGTEGIGLVGI